MLFFVFYIYMKVDLRINVINFIRLYEILDEKISNILNNNVWFGVKERLVI